MKPIILKSIILCLLFSSAFCLNAHAREATPPQESISTPLHDDNFEFSITQVENGQWINSQSEKKEDQKIIAKNDHGNFTEMLAITYQVYNNNPTRKFNFNHDFTFGLKDEFGNTYQQFKKPSDYPRAVLFTTNHFPSIYPFESFRETVFFEVPIKKSQELTFIMETKNFNNAQPVEIKIPVSVITAFQKEQAYPSPALIPGIKIVSPASGQTVLTGDLVQIYVMTQGMKLPESIVMVTLGTTFEDMEPGKNNVYDLNIPNDQMEGSLGVTVIGRWRGDSPEEDLVLSDNIILSVKPDPNQIQATNLPTDSDIQATNSSTDSEIPLP